MKLTEEEIRVVEEAIKNYPEKKAAIMDSLRYIQKTRRHIPKDLLPELSEMLEVPEKDIFGIVSFYTMYSWDIRGKYHVQICTNVSCKLNGGCENFKAISEYLSIGHNETDADGFFSLEEVECMGACGDAPMIAINDEYYNKIDKNGIIEVLKDLKAKA